MYFRRHIDTYLKQWKERPQRKPLLLRGARGVGKSSSVKHLGEEFEYFAEVNFETQPELQQVFRQISNVKEIVSRLSVLLNVPIIENRTLLFLDEIHACPEAIKSLWSFKENMPQLHVASASSLFEFALKELSSFGVGRISSIFMYPMSFDEFLMALGFDSWIEKKSEADYAHPLPTELHNSLVEQFRSFLMVGGMPASVALWIETHDYMRCQKVLDEIQQTYYDDFAKYPKIDSQLLKNTLLSVVKQVGQKFMYSRVEGNYRSEQVKMALAMLCDAGIVKMVQYSSGNGLLLGAQVKNNFKKYLYLDSALMLRILDIETGSICPLTKLILIGTAEELVNKGALIEMVAGWEILKGMSPRIWHALYYWENTEVGTISKIAYLSSKDMQILPIEIKADVTGKMKSLRLFMRSKHLLYGMRCSLENFGELKFVDKKDTLLSKEQKSIYIHPLYCLSTLGEIKRN